MHHPWLLAGNFNQVLSPANKHSTCNRMDGASEFRDALFDSDLLELRSSGLWFAWWNNRECNDLVMDKIDKSFCNEAWFSLYPDSHLFCLPIATSAHEPILIDTYKALNYKMHVFNFKNLWLTNEKCLDAVNQN